MSKKQRTVEVHEAGDIGTFMIRGSDDAEPKIIAEMAFQWDGPVMKILQTGVRPGYEDQGIAEVLVEAAVERAQTEDFKITPVCPFAQKIFDERADVFGDVRIHP